MKKIIGNKIRSNCNYDDDIYLKHFKNIRYKDYNISSHMFSKNVALVKIVKCPVCNSEDILLEKGNGENIIGFDGLGIICNNCKNIYLFYDVEFKF